MINRSIRNVHVLPTETPVLQNMLHIENGYKSVRKLTDRSVFSVSSGKEVISPTNLLLHLDLEPL